MSDDTTNVSRETLKREKREAAQKAASAHVREMGAAYLDTFATPAGHRVLEDLRKITQGRRSPLPDMTMTETSIFMAGQQCILTTILSNIETGEHARQGTDA